ncbi:MAG: FAD-dependent monooxygenase [Gemmatimonadaceae bacterium]|jgi:2-polyprenyl-6-methoxyphenol hydroxylase-like FAD-dependent oxidoreductase|nr:FAD-dependent monooxygenase [Gemmatimonadaceae bacterium]
MAVALPARSHAEVLVVGGGPAGAATATFLAQQGVAVELLDKARFPREKPCAEYLSPEASRLLDAMGVLHEVEAAGAAQLRGMLVRAPNGAVIHGEFAAAHGFRGFRDRGLALRRPVLDTLLLDAARRHGVAVHDTPAMAVRDLLRDANGHVVGVRTADGERRARLVIGADGLRSVVARRAGLARRARWPRRVALVAHYRDVAGLRDLGEMHVAHDGYVGIAPVGHGLVNVAVVVPTRAGHAIAGDPTAFFEAWLARQPQLVDRFAPATRVTAVQTTGPFAVACRRGWAPGVALVGDAAEFFDPFTGEGIFAALRGAELLAPIVHDVLRAPSAARGLALLGAYDAARRRAFAGKWRVERAIGLAVGVPALLSGAARVLARRRAVADLLVGVAGDFVPPRAVFSPRVLRELLLPSRS